MFSRRILSQIVVLILVTQSFVLINTDNSSNFVEDSSPLEQVPEYGFSGNCVNKYGQFF